jgi:hypothetical protein
LGKDLHKLAGEFQVAVRTEDQAEIRHEAQRLTKDYAFSPKALTEWSAEAYAIWCLTYVPHLVPEVEEWQVDSIDSVFNDPRVLLMWPATTGKTTMFSIAHPLWIGVGNPDVEQLGVFKDDNEGKSALGAIKNEMTDNEKLIADYGQLKPTNTNRSHKWTEHRVDFAQRTRRSKQSSLMFYPYGGQVLGQRSHRRFADDIVTLKIAMSATMNFKQRKWFTVDFEPGGYAPQDRASYMKRYDQILVCMTRMTPEDLGHYLETRVTEEVAAANSAVRPFRCHIVDLLDEENQQTITKRYTWNQAMAMRAEMKEAFDMRFRNLVVTDETARFKRVYFDGGEFEGVTYPGCWNREFTWESAIDPKMTVAIGYDPQSGSQTNDAAEAAIVMLGNLPNGLWKPRLLDWHSGKSEAFGDKDTKSQVSVILRMAKRCNEHGITPWVVLEQNNVQRAFRVAIIEAAQRMGVMLRVTMSPTTGPNKWDDETGVEASVIDFENGWLEIPGEYPSDEKRYRGFIDKMVAYGRSSLIDVPIAYWKSRQWLYEHRGQHDQRTQVMTITKATPRRVVRRLQRLGRTNGLVIRDAYAQQEVSDGQRVQ